MRGRRATGRRLGWTDQPKKRRWTMLCSICDQTRRPGGTHLGTREAVGICLRCGAAVCAEHGARAREGGLVCPTCALELPAARTAAPRGELTALSA